MKRRWWIYGLAAAAGVALALPWGREHAADTSVAPQPPASRVHRDSAPVATDASQAAASVPSAPPEARLYANSGLEFEPLHAADVFVGYAVIRSHDPRLAVGDVVIAVGGEPVEEGAAGSELLIAALRNPSAELTIQQRSDWQPSTDWSPEP
jgi:hypothetical protein